jgi:hypothetical protein
MPLKYFHILFIGLSVLMTLGIAIWAIEAWRASGASSWLVFAAIALIGGGALVLYGSQFLKKIRNLGIAGLLVAGTLGLPNDALACPACIGNTDSILRSGMNTGILALLGVTFFVLACFATFFIYLVRRARAATPAEGSV